MSNMRAKMRIVAVKKNSDVSEELIFSAVGPDGSYPADGSDEDNSYARWTPSGELRLSITNPALHGKFKEGEKYYLDFTRADA